MSHFVVENPIKNNLDWFTIEDHLHDFDDVGYELKYVGNLNENAPMPLISIMIPAYRLSFISHSIESAINQDFPYPYEIVIIDDCGGDSENLFQYVKSLNSPLLKLYKNEHNIGLFGNWNRCILLAKAKYICYLHCDDMLKPNTLSLLWSAHNENAKECAIFGQEDWIEPDGITIHKYYKKKGIFHSKKGYLISDYGILLGDSHNGCGALLNVKCLEELGGWNPNFYPATDRQMFLMYREKWGMYKINEVIRIGTTSISESGKLYKMYPAINYYLQKAAIDRYFRFKSFFYWLIKHYYICYESKNHLYEENNKMKKAPFVSRVVNYLFKCSYWSFAGKTIF